MNTHEQLMSYVDYGRIGRKQSSETPTGRATLERSGSEEGLLHSREEAVLAGPRETGQHPSAQEAAGFSPVLQARARPVVTPGGGVGTRHALSLKARRALWQEDNQRYWDGVVAPGAPPAAQDTAVLQDAGGT